jgi:hypothetical protein
VALGILRGTIEGKTWREMVSDFGISEAEFRAADRRLRRKLNQLMGGK